MDRSRQLDNALLVRLEDRLRASRAESVRAVSDGLSTEEIRQAVAVLGIDVPAEAELWWRWSTWGAGYILPDAQYLTLDAALAQRRIRREWATTASHQPGWPPEDPDLLWDPTWLPVFADDGGVLLVLELSESDGTVAPITKVDGQAFGSDFFAVRLAASLGEFVADQLDAVDRGRRVYDQETGIWRDDTHV